MPDRRGASQLVALMRARLFFRPVSLSLEDDEVFQAVSALMGDESKTDAEIVTDLSALRDANPRRFRRVAHCFRALCDPKENLDDRAAVALVESVAFGLQDRPVSQAAARRMEAIGDLRDLPVEAQWHRLVERVPALESVREKAMGIWDARGRPTSMPRRAEEMRKVLLATRPLHRRAKEMIAEAVPDRGDPFRSEFVEEVAYSWIDGAALIGQAPTDPESLGTTDDA